MLRLLNISSYAVLALSIVAAAFITLNRQNTGGDVATLLSSPLTAEKYKGNIPAAANKGGSQSPLRTAADALALRLNPPAPKVTPNVRNTPSVPTPATNTVRPTTPVIAKFDLLGTCVNNSDPALSMVYVNVAGEGRKWVYQGEMIGRLKIEQVKDDSVVYSDGANKNELPLSQSPSEIKSLLKSDSPQAQQTPATAANTAPPANLPGQRRMPARVTAPTTAVSAVPKPVTPVDPQKQQEQLESSLKLLSDIKSGDEKGDKELAESMKKFQEMIKAQEKLNNIKK